MFYSEAYHAVHLEISVYILSEEKSTRGGGGANILTRKPVTWLLE